MLFKNVFFVMAIIGALFGVIASALGQWDKAATMWATGVFCLVAYYHEK